jgi:hypothetical protein
MLNCCHFPAEVTKWLLERHLKSTLIRILEKAKHILANSAKHLCADPLTQLKFQIPKKKFQVTLMPAVNQRAERSPTLGVEVAVISARTRSNREINIW